MNAPNKTPRDIDNHAKAILDSMTHAGVWVDDEQVDILILVRGEIQKHGSAIVEWQEIEAA